MHQAVGMGVGLVGHALKHKITHEVKHQIHSMGKSLHEEIKNGGKHGSVAAVSPTGESVKNTDESSHDTGCHLDHRNRLWVELSKVSYTGGNIVQGTVHLSVMEPFSANGVLLKLKGYERAHWEEWKTPEAKQHGKPAEKYLHEHKESNDIFCQRIPLFAAGLVEAGEHCFPFQYNLPASLPGTFYEKGGQWSSGTGYAGSVVYYLKAKVDLPFRHSLHHKVFLVVNEPIHAAIQPSFAKNNKTFMLTKGRLEVKVNLDRNCYFPGNTVIANVEANNTSVKATDEVNVRVFRVLELSAHGQNWKDRKEVYHERHQGFEPSFYGAHWLPFQIPMDMQPSTTSSQLVKSNYLFVIECAIPGAINLKVELPVRILAPEWLWTAAPQLPPPVQLPADMSFRPPWQLDSTALKCGSCMVAFSLLKRKHHCRGCGKVFCGNCVAKTAIVESLGYTESPVPVCDACHTAVQQGTLAPFGKPSDLHYGPSKEYPLSHEYAPSAPMMNDV